MSLFLTIPSTVYMFHYFRAKRKNPIDEKRLKWAGRRLFVIAPLAVSLSFTAWTYEKTNRFEQRLK